MLKIILAKSEASLKCIYYVMVDYLLLLYRCLFYTIWVLGIKKSNTSLKQTFCVPWIFCECIGNWFAWLLQSFCSCCFKLKYINSLLLQEMKGQELRQSHPCPVLFLATVSFHTWVEISKRDVLTYVLGWSCSGK